MKILKVFLIAGLWFLSPLALFWMADLLRDEMTSFFPHPLGIAAVVFFIAVPSFAAGSVFVKAEASLLWRTAAAFFGMVIGFGAVALIWMPVQVDRFVLVAWVLAVIFISAGVYDAKNPATVKEAV